MATPGSHRTLLCFDYGRKRIGVAVGQGLTRTATPLLTIHARDGKPDWSRIDFLIEEWHPDALVVGIPYHMDGSAQAMSAAAERFCRQLEGRCRLPVYRAEERLSSYAVETAGPQGRAPDNQVDALAAQLILQDWLQQQESKT